MLYTLLSAYSSSCYIMVKARSLFLRHMHFCYFHRRQRTQRKYTTATVENKRPLENHAADNIGSSGRYSPNGRPTISLSFRIQTHNSNCNMYSGDAVLPWGYWVERANEWWLPVWIYSSLPLHWTIDVEWVKEDILSSSFTKTISARAFSGFKSFAQCIDAPTSICSWVSFILLFACEKTRRPSENLTGVMDRAINYAQHSLFFLYPHSSTEQTWV